MYRVCCELWPPCEFCKVYSSSCLVWQHTSHTARCVHGYLDRRLSGKARRRAGLRGCWLCVQFMLQCAPHTMSALHDCTDTSASSKHAHQSPLSRLAAQRGLNIHEVFSKFLHPIFMVPSNFCYPLTVLCRAEHCTLLCFWCATIKNNMVASSCLCFVL